ncbi:MAG TPA: hypothetical protein VFD75_07050 [Pyrinomonadaceae bacterium]|nr:hypothetical protein [Pyrinomonadaceae bacterium]
MNFADITQIGIIALTGTGIWMIGRPERWSRWGYVLGLAGQPVWLYMSLHANLWGVTIVTLLCSYGWAQGVWFKVVKAPKDPDVLAAAPVDELINS